MRICMSLCHIKFHASIGPTQFQLSQCIFGWLLYVCVCWFPRVLSCVGLVGRAPRFVCKMNKRGAAKSVVGCGQILPLGGAAAVHCGAAAGWQSRCHRPPSFGDSGMSSVLEAVGDIIGARLQCKLVSWIGVRVWGSAGMAAWTSASNRGHRCFNRRRCLLWL